MYPPGNTTSPSFSVDGGAITFRAPVVGNNYIYSKSDVDSQLTNYYTKSNVDDQLTNYYNKSTVDSNFYNKSTVDSNYYTKAQTKNLCATIYKLPQGGDPQWVYIGDYNAVSRSGGQASDLQLEFVSHSYYNGHANEDSIVYLRFKAGANGNQSELFFGNWADGGAGLFHNTTRQQCCLFRLCPLRTI